MTSPLERLAAAGGTLHREVPDPAALRRCGYRSDKRYVVFQALPHTLDLGPEVWRVLDKCHRLRNQSEYEGDLHVEERLVAELITACSAVEAALEALGALTQ